MNLFSENHCVRSYHTNKYSKASLTSLFDFMLDAAWGHAQVLDWGYDKLQSNNLFWVLSRMYIEVERYPDWQEEIIVKTWPAGTDGMFAYRNFLIETKSGELILKASSSWLILNLETKKIFLLRAYKDTFPKLESPGHCRLPQKIKPAKHPDKLFFNPVLFSELDLNKHFNSVKALERVLDDFGTDFLDVNEPFKVEVNYLKEGMQGDSLTVIHHQQSENKFCSGIVRESDKADLFTVEIEWRRRN